ncbi:MAG: hypothetical protein DWQ01_05455 [Planctomycetota bacterium]|nr:MAG: hypothetical protein DWQ01_05455 [Planctomycetota bacterium]
MDGAALTAAPSPAAQRNPWINGARWDIGWLIGSALIVPVVLFFVWNGTGADWINLGVTAIVGGPHLFSTYTASYMDPRFRRGHRGVLLAATLLVPAFVIYWTLTDFQILLSVFIFAASFHVLHQNAYLTGIYNKKSGRKEPTWSRLVDYGVLLLCIYPIASYKLVHSDFYLGSVEIILPSFMKVPATYWTIWLAFGSLFAIWLWKTAGEYRRQVLNLPKTVLIAVTCLVCFFVPMAATGERLELAFQSVNAWHSIQYLGLIWYIQKVRKERGEIETPFIAKMSGGTPGAMLRYYGFCFLLTLALGGVVAVCWFTKPFALEFQQYYYMCVLSCLLIHYFLDGFFFTVGNRAGAARRSVPFAAPTAA